MPREAPMSRDAQNLTDNTSNFKSTIYDMEKLYSKRKATVSDFEKFRTELAKKSDIERLQSELKNSKLSAEAREALEKKLSASIRKVEEAAYKAAAEKYVNIWKGASNTRKIEMGKAYAEEEKKRRKAAEDDYAIRKQQLKQNLGESEEYYQQLAELEKEQSDYVLNSIAEESKQRKAVHNLEMKQAQSLDKKLSNVAKSRAKQAKLARDHVVDLSKEYEELKEAGADESTLAAKASEIKKAGQTADFADFKASITNSLKNAVEGAFTRAVDMAGNTVKKSFDEVEQILTDYRGSVDARLQGSGKSFSDIMDMTITNTLTSPYVKTTEVLKAVKQASDEGIAYNIEQRAFLSTITEKIASTFDAFDSNLTRLIRLQQADTTAARLGMEASLTKFFNNMFQDTSYLKEMSDMVSGAIIDANSQLDKSQSAEFEYVVQKWLGSLASLGMSSTAVSSIAEGINYLATGNVQALASNSPLQTLFAMSASRSGLEYSDLLLQGLNASTTNRLLQGMVEYLKTIADNTDNQVVKGAYGNIFNMSMSDFRAIQNLTTSDIANIAGSTLTYSNMISELNNQFSQIAARSTLSEMVSNVTSNAMFGLGQELYSNPFSYGMMKVLDAMDALGLDVNIPFGTVMGTGMDLNASVNQLLRLGIGLVGATKMLPTIFESLSSGGALSLANWGGTEYNQRGTGTLDLLSTMLGGRSSSTYVSSGSMRDMKLSALSSATDEAAETQKITNKGMKTEHTFDDFYIAVIGTDAKSFINVKESYLSRAFDEGNNWIRAYDTTIDTRITTIFGTTSFYEHRLKVSDDSLDRYSQGNSIRVVDSGLNSVTSALMEVKNATQAQTSMAKASAGIVNVNEDSIKNAIISAMKTNESPDTTSLLEVLKLFKEGKITVMAKPESGTRFDVTVNRFGTDAAQQLRRS